MRRFKIHSPVKYSSVLSHKMRKAKFLVLFIATAMVSNQFGSDALPTTTTLNNTENSFNTAAAYPVDAGNDYELYDYQDGTEEDDQPMKLDSDDSGNNKPELQLSEFQDITKIELIKYEENKKECYIQNSSYFWDAHKGSCESCDKFCKGDNLTHCPFQCKDYINTKELQNHILEMWDALRETDNKKVDLNVVAILFVLLLLFLGALFVHYIKTTRTELVDLKYELKEVTIKLNQALPEGDRATKVPTEKDAMISSPAQEERTM